MLSVQTNQLTSVGFLSGMQAFMTLQIRDLSKSFVAVVTMIGLFSWSEKARSRLKSGDGSHSPVE